MFRPQERNFFSARKRAFLLKGCEKTAQGVKKRIRNEAKTSPNALRKSPFTPHGFRKNLSSCRRRSVFRVALLFPTFRKGSVKPMTKVRKPPRTGKPAVPTGLSMKAFQPDGKPASLGNGLPKCPGYFSDFLRHPATPPDGNAPERGSVPDEPQFPGSPARSLQNFV